MWIDIVDKCRCDSRFLKLLFPYNEPLVLEYEDFLMGIPQRSQIFLTTCILWNVLQ